MFYYRDTGKLSKPGEVQKKFVTKCRAVRYLNDSPNPKVAEPIITEGFEIVEEIAVSPDFNFSKAVTQVVGQKTVDRRNPNRVVDRSFSKQTQED